MKICIAGACGRMGQRILEMAAAADDIEVGAAFDLPKQAGTALVYGAAESGGVITLSAGAKDARAVAGRSSRSISESCKVEGIARRYGEAAHFRNCRDEIRNSHNGKS